MTTPTTRFTQYLSWFLLTCTPGCSAGVEVGLDEDAILARYLQDQPEFIQEHNTWHANHTLRSPTFGVDFLTYHHQILRDFDEWRQEHGLSPLRAWDPATPIPRDTPHAGRLTDDPSAADPRSCKPTWLTIEGGPQADPQTGARRLADFADANLIGKSINAPGDPNWHGSLHNAIGGDMADMHTAPLDPIFWQFHRTIDDVWLEWQSTAQ